MAAGREPAERLAGVRARLAGALSSLPLLVRQAGERADAGEMRALRVALAGANWKTLEAGVANLGRRYPLDLSGILPAEAAVETSVTAAAAIDMLAEIGRLKQAGLPSDEFAQTRRSLLGRYSRVFETTAQVADSLTGLLDEGLPADFHAMHLRALRAATLDEVDAAVHRRLHPDRFVVVAVGDVERIGASLEAMDLGPIRTIRDAAT